MSGQNSEQAFHQAAAFLSVPEDDDPDSHAKRALWQQLLPLERAMLATDGSFTLLLAALHGEAIKPEVIAQEQRRLTYADRTLRLEKNESLLERRVLLRTAASERPVTYAESLIVPSRLSPAMYRDLTASSRPIGLLLRREAVETHRVLLDWGKRQPPQLVKSLFGAKSFLFSSYLIIARALPLMMVSEYFPATSRKLTGADAA